MQQQPNITFSFVHSWKTKLFEVSDCNKSICNESICYDHTCAAGIPCWRTLCSIRGLCGDTKVIATARNQAIDIILSCLSYVTVTNESIWALPGQIVTIAFLVFVRCVPRDCDDLLLCRSHKRLHTERSWWFEREMSMSLDSEGETGKCLCLHVARVQK